VNWFKTAQQDILFYKIAGLDDWLLKHTRVSIPLTILVGLSIMHGLNIFVNSLQNAPTQEERDRIAEKTKQEVWATMQRNPDVLREARQMIQEDFSRKLPAQNIYPENKLKSPFTKTPSTIVNIEIWIDRIIKQESQGNPKAVSPKGAVGIMQIMPKTWTEMSKKVYGKPLPLNERTNPEKNKKVGTAYLKEIQDILRKEFKKEPTIEQILAAYNGGPYRLIEKKGNVWAMPEETRKYVEKITGTKRPKQ